MTAAAPARRAPWTEDETERALDWVRAHGVDTYGLAAHMGEPRPVVINRIRTMGERYRDAVAEWRATPQGIGEQHARLVEDTAARDAHLAETFDWLRPVTLPPVERPRVKAKAAPYVVVSSDHHWPLHDYRVESILLQVIAALKPRAYVLNGDGPDLLALSRYPKDARAGKSWPLRDEQLGAKSWWRAVAQAGAAWDIELYETEANHSGNDQASRWRRWLNENAAALFTLDGFEERMSYQSYFHPDDVAVQLVDEVVIAGDLRIRHGELARKGGGYSARAHGEKWGGSVLHGHTHRIGSSIKRRPGIPGHRDDEFIRTFETGCACRINADYAPGADWAQGFAIIAVDDATGSYAVEQCQVIDGRATIAALGATLTA